MRPGTLHAAILRSPHAHAEIAGIDVAEALAAPGVAAVLIGADVKRLTSSMVVGVKAPLECWPIATDRVRYVGEPVAIVVARDRYLAEDALDLIEVDYKPLPAIVDPVGALAQDAPILHPSLGSNLASERSFRYGDPERAFAQAPHHVVVAVRYPRNSCTPIETYGVVAEYDPGDDAYDVLANFQGPFSIHAVISRALKIPGNRLRLRTPPDSGGSFGVKQGVFPYIILIAAASRVAGAPVKWIEDRLENLAGAVVGDEPSHKTRRGSRNRWAHHRSRLESNRGLRRELARAGTCHALSYARQHDGGIRGSQCRDPQPGRAHQQNAERIEPRVRRPAGLLCA